MTGADAIKKLFDWCLVNSRSRGKKNSDTLDLDWWMNKEMMIIGLSASARDDELMRAFEHGMHFFCPKPVETSMLASILQMRRCAPTLAIALANIGKQAVKVESSKILSGNNVNRLTISRELKEKNENDYLKDYGVDEEAGQTCTGSTLDVATTKGHTGWKLFNKISKLLIGGKINPGDDDVADGAASGTATATATAE